MIHNFFIDRFIHFYDYVHLEGWIMASDPVDRIVLVSPHLLAGEIEHGLPSPDLAGAAENARFSGRFLVGKNFDALTTRLCVYFSNGKAPAEISHAEMLEKLRAVRKPTELDDRFREMVRAREYERLVEIGSRARCGVVRKDIFEGKTYTGVDVLQGENVDLLADAHQLSRHFKPESVDAVFSLNTFEHLAMPLQVILEMNKILRPGGLVFLDAPQTIGLHEMPWDFFRFSDRAWESLLNAHTGFEVLATQMSHPTHIVPLFYLGGAWKGYEASAGFNGSAVLARKTGPASVQLDGDFSKTAFGVYPV
jgi:SAM-dependent methyltransferase